MLVLNFPAFENKKCTAYGCFHGNGSYGKILTKKEPIKMLGFISRLCCHIIKLIIVPYKFLTLTKVFAWFITQ